MMKANCCKWSLNKLLFFSYKSFFIFFVIIWNTRSNYVTIFTSFLYFGLAVHTCNGYTHKYKYIAVVTIIWLMQTTCNTLIRKIITAEKYRFWFRKMEIGQRRGAEGCMRKKCVALGVQRMSIQLRHWKIIPLNVFCCSATICGHQVCHQKILVNSDKTLSHCAPQCMTIASVCYSWMRWES